MERMKIKPSALRTLNAVEAMLLANGNIYNGCKDPEEVICNAVNSDEVTGTHMNSEGSASSFLASLASEHAEGGPITTGDLLDIYRNPPYPDFF
tara:strand:- start:4674 stop:4955 length:282 start_codon:yes stop_codon:yes gene_type:complete